MFTWLPGCPEEVFLIAPNPKFASKGFKIRTTPNQQNFNEKTKGRNVRRSSRLGTHRTVSQNIIHYMAERMTIVGE